jgi:hypothetical protein
VGDGERRQDAPRGSTTLAPDFADPDQRSVVEIADSILVAVNPQRPVRLAVGTVIRNRHHAVAEVLKALLDLAMADVEDDRAR